MRSPLSSRGQLSWCDACHTPVLSRACSRCGRPTRKVTLTPPGDARPAFPADIALVNRIYADHFGSPLVPEGNLALLNKVPDTDRMEEVIVGGGVAGAIRYLPAEHRWEAIPRVEAYGLLKSPRKWVVVDGGAAAAIRVKSASVLAPGLVEIEPSVRAGDEVFVLDEGGECIAVGRARVDAPVAASMERGLVVRTRRTFSSLCVPGRATWDDAVAANAAVLGEREGEAVEFVRNVARSHALPVNVSYSGGKDSLATLILVRKALGDVPILFADTGLEFPETYGNVDDVAETYGLPVERTSGRDAFWDAFSVHGPPSRDFRWCCRAAKLGPVERLIREKWGECLSFIGQRKYESARRMASHRVWRNPHVPAQVSAAPIHHWTALHVWLYLFREKAPYNPLYEEGIDRIGCFMCPSSDVAVIRNVISRYPDLWEGWAGRLREWQHARGLPDSWVEDAAWRVREVSGEDDCNC
ncbi:MAG: phosphoadenosine phosphosulfate reductase family protein [Methanolinea sp.]|nr:phosphoadenosine phosphosulfate reductase family protein [Methanolinea sp.]